MYMSNIDSFQLEQEKLFHSLAAIELDSWQRLSKGSLSSKNDFYLPVVGTIKANQTTLRTVVLRKVWPSEKQLAFHTDIRSDKINDLVTNPSVSWLFYSKTHRLQLRLMSKATIHTNDDITETAWLQTSPSSRKCYLSNPKPGSVSPQVSSGLPDFMTNRDPTEEESRPGKINFAVIITKVESLEWLWLNKKGHRRAIFEYENTNYNGQWLIP
jgi:pyridoxamine 5'-phosphate oxidase